MFSMFSKLKPIPRAIVIFGIVGAVAYGANVLLDKKVVSLPSGNASTANIVSKIASKSADALNVSIVQFHGYAPGLLANGGLVTADGSIYNKLGVKVNFIIQDNMPSSTELFESGTADCVWRTSDFWAQEQPNLRNAKHDGRAVMVVDNTQGGDAIITKDQSINSIEDLAGKSVALVQYTPSHGMLVDAINNSSMTPKKKASVKPVFSNAEEGIAGAASVFSSGSADAVVLWDPVLSLTMKKTGAKVVYSTKNASNLIYDVMVCNKKVIDDPNGAAKIDKFVAGWMQGVKQAKNDPDAAVKVLVDNQKDFAEINKSEGPAFIKSLFSSVVWTGLEDNARILGLTGDTNHYERVYTQFDSVYRSIGGTLANPNSPVIPANQSFDYRFIKNAIAASGERFESKQEVFAPVAPNAKVALSKPVIINFESGSAELSAKSKNIIDKEMVPFIENNGKSHIEIAGNTDSVGSDASNKALSYRRAQTVANYLVSQWEVPKQRLKVVGNGSTKPICQEPGTSDNLTLDECRSLNRSTQVGVLN